MSARWVAGGVRGRGLSRRRLGPVGARAVATAGSVPDAVALLAASPYGRDVRPGMDVADAGRAIGRTCLWHLRVLAGWSPPRSGSLVRVFAARYELENIADLCGRSGTGEAPAPYELGGLGVAWSRLQHATSADERRAALTASTWGDPGTVTWPAVVPALEARWASWLADAVPSATAWAAASAARVAAGAIVSGAAVPDAARSSLRRLLGRRWEDADTLAALTDAVPTEAAWVLDGLDDVDRLWVADGRWWQRVERDATALARSSRPGPSVSSAVAALLLADAHRARAALDAAAWGQVGLDVFDAVA